MASADHNHVWAAKHFGIACGSMMSLFIISHWARIILKGHGFSSTVRALGPFRKCYRYDTRPQRLEAALTLAQHRAIQRALNAVVLGTDIKKWIIYLIFWGINLILILTNVNLNEIKDVCLLSIGGSDC